MQECGQTADVPPSPVTAGGSARGGSDVPPGSLRSARFGTLPRSQPGLSRPVRGQQLLPRRDLRPGESDEDDGHTKLQVRVKTASC